VAPAVIGRIWPRPNIDTDGEFGAGIRRGGDVAFVCEELKQIFDRRGGQWSKGRYVPSLVAANGDILERRMISTGFLTPEREGLQ
jgi:ribonucleoside-diphosphate reductase alpha chain